MIDRHRGFYLNKVKVGDRKYRRLFCALFMETGIFSAFSPPDIQTGSETLIQTALSRLIKNKTVPVIAHRMRTVAGADKIVVLKNGVVAEQGSPDELYRRGGIY